MAAADSSHHWLRRRRIEFFPERDLGLADVLHFGYYNQDRAEAGLEMHTHARAMEFCYLVRGRQTYRVRGRDFRMAGGDVFLTLPDEPHGTGGEPQEKGVLFWISLRLPAGRPRKSWLGLAPGAAVALREALLDLRNRHFPAPWRLHEHLRSMMGRLIAPCDDLDGVALQSRLVLLLLETIEASREAAVKTGRRRPSSLDAIARDIERDLAEPAPLAVLAAKAGLSLPRFKALFKKEFGVPPGEYVLRARVSEARRRLETTNAAVTAICFDLGFSSSQYFSTVMKRYTGRTPSALREAAARRV